MACSLFSTFKSFTSLDAFLGPMFAHLVIFAHGRDACRQRHPGLLGRYKDMDIRRHRIGIVECSDPKETDCFTGQRIMAPQRDMAFWTARNRLALAALRWRIDKNDIALKELHPVTLNKRVLGKCRPGFPLAPSAMAAMNEHRF